MKDLKENIRFAVENAVMGDIFTNSEYEEKVLNFMKHAIGMDYHKPYKRHQKSFYRPYRNHYDAGGTDIIVWDVLTEMGLAYKIQTYHLTPAGFEWLGKRLNVHIYPVER